LIRWRNRPTASPSSDLCREESLNRRRTLNENRNDRGKDSGKVQAERTRHPPKKKESPLRRRKRGLWQRDTLRLVVAFGEILVGAAAKAQVDTRANPLRGSRGDRKKGRAQKGKEILWRDTGSGEEKNCMEDDFEGECPRFRSKLAAMGRCLGRNSG